jgi:hypothetical protein
MSIVLLGSTSGSCTLQEQAVAGTSVLTLPVGTGTVVANNVNSAIVSGTAVASTSGTSIDFTSIPSWVKRVTIMWNGVSTNSTSQRQVQLGTISGVETTSYTSSGFGWTGGTNGSSSTTGILFDGLNPAAATAYNAVMIINSFGSNTWVASCLTAATTGTVQQFMTTGAKTLAGTLDRVRITTVNGTDTFDAGSINILYE